MSFGQQLLDRRVPQFLAAYVVASWGFLQFVQFLEERYLLSPHLVDVIGLSLLLLLPSVVMLAWGHGRPGKDTWQRRERVGVPVNILLGVAVLFMVFQGKALGKTTTTIEIQDEDGNVAERIVPKNEFRKSLMLFFCRNETSDESMDWLRHGIPSMLAQDLYQNVFLDLTDCIQARDEMARAGFQDGRNIPRPLMRELAADRHVGWFTSGSFRRENNEYVVELSINDVAAGTETALLTARNRDIFRLIDDLTVQVLHNLDIPTKIEGMPDLAVTDIFTDSEPAARRFAEGVLAFFTDNDFAAAAAAIGEATTIDPAFTLAHFQHYVFATTNGQVEEGRVSLANAMEHLYRVSERIALSIKVSHFLDGEQDGKKAMASAQMWADLYPNDLDASKMLYTLHGLQGNKAQQIEQAQRILTIDPTQHEFLLTIGDLYQAEGDAAQARSYFERYAKRFPDDYKPYARIARILSDDGDFEAARAYLEKAVVRAPERGSLELQRARIEEALGQFESAERVLLAAVEHTSTPNETTNAYASTQSFYERRGRIAEAMAYRELRYEAMAKSDLPIRVIAVRAYDSELFARIGQIESTRKKIDELLEFLPPNMGAIHDGARIMFDLIAVEDSTNASARLTRYEEYMETAGLQILRPMAMLARGKLHILAGDHKSAVEALRQASKLAASHNQPRRELARALRLDGGHDEAKRELEKCLKNAPFDGYTLMEMARLHRDKGRRDEALVYIDKALVSWSDADDAFIPRKQAQELREELRRAS